MSCSARPGPRRRSERSAARSAAPVVRCRASTTRTARRRPPTASSGADARRQVVGPGPHALAHLARSAGGASRRAAPRARSPVRARCVDDGDSATAPSHAQALRAQAPVLRRLPAPHPPGELVHAVVRPRARRARPSGSAPPGPCPRRSRTARTSCTRRAPAQPGRAHAEQQARDRPTGPSAAARADAVLRSCVICCESVISDRWPPR